MHVSAAVRHGGRSSARRCCPHRFFVHDRLVHRHAPRQRVRRVRLFQITHIFRAEGQKLDGYDVFTAVLLNILGISAESKGCQFLVVQISQAVTAAVYAGVSMHCLSTYSNRNG